MTPFGNGDIGIGMEIADATSRTDNSAVATGLILPLPSTGASWAMPTDRQHVLQCAVAKNLSNSVKQYGNTLHLSESNTENTPHLSWGTCESGHCYSCRRNSQGCVGPVAPVE